MATFNELGYSGAKIGGCATVVYIDIYLSKYGPGDTLFNIFAARKGILEKVVIKKVKLANMALTGSQPVPLYIDTFNGLWNESDLVPFSVAQTTAIAYEEDLLARLQALNKC